MKKGDKLDIGFIEKLGTTATASMSQSNSQMQNSTERVAPPSDTTTIQPNSSSNNVPSAVQNGDGISGKPQKGEPGHEEPHEEETGAARGDAAPSGTTAMKKEDYPEPVAAGKLDGVGPEYYRMNHAVSV